MFHIISQFSSVFNKSFHYSTYFSSAFSIPASRAATAAIHNYIRAAAAIHVHPRTAAAAAALKFHPKHATNKNKAKHNMKIPHINIIYDKAAIILLFSSLFFRIFHIFSLFNLPFLHIFHIFSLFNLLSSIFSTASLFMTKLQQVNKLVIKMLTKHEN
jgi:hypothetical protein